MSVRARSPFLDDLASLVEICEQVLVETLVAQAAVEAFDKAVLRRLAGRDAVPLDPELLLPGQRMLKKPGFPTHSHVLWEAWPNGGLAGWGRSTDRARLHANSLLTGKFTISGV